MLFWTWFAVFVNLHQALLLMSGITICPLPGL